MKKLLILPFLLCACAKSTPVETIADSHIDHINQTLEYAATLEQTKDVVFLENELKSCQMGMVGLKQAYYGEISTCKAKTDYWRLSALGLFVAILGAIFVIIKRIF